jgi:hypothetical protein
VLGSLWAFLSVTFLPFPGSGKTELCKQFKDEKFWVLDEGFMDMPEYALHPQSLLMETSWVVNWFMRLLKHASEIKDKDGPEPVRLHALYWSYHSLVYPLLPAVAV